jgi:N-acetylglutamate synthase-like GNAT family acetyltransferase
MQAIGFRQPVAILAAGAGRRHHIRMIRNASPEDFPEILAIINDAARAYQGVIPDDRWHEPYMPADELREQIAQGVRFSLYIADGGIVGVMGVQDKGDVLLIRHAYVRTTRRNQGIGTILLRELTRDATKPVLIGTWKAASWAIRFYERHGFRLVGEDEKTRLLEKYWSIPGRQVETSVVLVDPRYLESAAR